MATNDELWRMPIGYACITTIDKCWEGTIRVAEFPLLEKIQQFA